MKKVEIIIKDTTAGCGMKMACSPKFSKPARYEIPQARAPFRPKRPWRRSCSWTMRERDLTIKGQEILTSDKVALRVSIIVQFRVIDPQACHFTAVEKYEDRLYSDVQLAARRSLASMTLEDF